MTIPVRRSSPWIAAAIAFGCVWSVGCNSKGLVPVEGRITFAGANPPTFGYIYFLPREMSINKRADATGPLPATARFETDGTFRGTTFINGDGIRPGTYEVRIDCSVTPANLTEEQAHRAPSVSKVPKAFAPPDLVVPTSGPRPVRYDLDVK